MSELMKAEKEGKRGEESGWGQGRIIILGKCYDSQETNILGRRKHGSHLRAFLHKHEN